jgi:transcription termination factor Rho
MARTKITLKSKAAPVEEPASAAAAEPEIESTVAAPDDDIAVTENAANPAGDDAGEAAAPAPAPATSKKGAAQQSQGERLDLAELKKKTISELVAIAKGMGLEGISGLKKQDLIFQLLKSQTERNGLIFSSGVLEVLPDGYGLCVHRTIIICPVLTISMSPPSQIRLFGLRTGDTVTGQIRPPKDNERFYALLRIEAVNFEHPDYLQKRILFDNLTPLYPDQRINLETVSEAIDMRIVNIMTPIGKGQRALIVAPPRTGKTILLQKIANAITTNHPEVYLIVLLIDERPEEVTDMQRSVRGEVVSSTFDEPASRHVQVAEMVIEKAKRLVEHKKDVVILLDQ